MKARWLLLSLMIIPTILLLSCQKQDDFEGLVPETPQYGLYLKSAQAGETVSITYFEQGEGMKSVYIPDDILIEVKEDSSASVKNRLLLIADYHVMSDGEAVFRVYEPGSRPIVVTGSIGGHQTVDVNTENVYANRLPDNMEYGNQAQSGKEAFNGLLKAGNLVISVNVSDSKIIIYNLDDQKASEGVVTSYNDDILSFQVGGEKWELKLVGHMVYGNTFQLSMPNGTVNCYTILNVRTGNFEA